MSSYRIVLGVPSADMADEVIALAEESGAVEVVQAASSTGDVMDALSITEVDAVLIHEDIGPLPALDLAREITARFPDTGVVLMARVQTPELLRAALQGGIRGIVTLPLSLEDLSTTVESTAAWAQAIRRRVSGELAEIAAGESSGTMLVLAGAKGGVGTTTIGVQLALEAQRAGRHRTVCLVDLDLQTGDVRNLLDLTHRRSLMDLADVAEDITARHLEDSLYQHPTGLRILLPPLHGEHAEDVDGRLARQILGAIKSRFDVVIVDVGSVMTEAAAVATEMANQVIVVTTPDVAALRAANRLLGLWERLQVRKDRIAVLVNRASKESEVQPDLVSKAVAVPLLKTTLPAAFRGLEAATNTGEPGRLEDTLLRRALGELAVEVQLVAPRGRGARRTKGRDESGQVAAETVGMAGMIMFVFLLLCQVVLVGYTFMLTSHAAREGARELAVDGDVEAVALEDVPQRWQEISREAENLDMVKVSGSDVTVTLKVPALTPGFDPDWRVSFSAGTVKEQ